MHSAEGPFAGETRADAWLFEHSKFLRKHFQHQQGPNCKVKSKHQMLKDRYVSQGRRVADILGADDTAIREEAYRQGLEEGLARRPSKNMMPERHASFVASSNERLVMTMVGDHAQPVSMTDSHSTLASKQVARNQPTQTTTEDCPIPVDNEMVHVGPTTMMSTIAPQMNGFVPVSASKAGPSTQADSQDTATGHQPGHQKLHESHQCHIPGSHEDNMQQNML